jgi:hypothetical protein
LEAGKLSGWQEPGGFSSLVDLGSDLRGKHCSDGHPHPYHFWGASRGKGGVGLGWVGNSTRVVCDEDDGCERRKDDGTVAGAAALDKYFPAGGVVCEILAPLTQTSPPTISVYLPFF